MCVIDFARPVGSGSSEDDVVGDADFMNFEDDDARGFLEVEVENLAGLFDALLILLGTVTGGNNFFGNRPVKVGTPVGDHAVRGVGSITFAAVADDAMEGNAGGYKMHPKISLAFMPPFPVRPHGQNNSCAKAAATTSANSDTGISLPAS